MEHFVIVLPQSIQFAASQAGLFKDEKPPEPGAVAEVAVNVHPGKSLAFSLSGDGVLQSQNSAGGTAQAREQRQPLKRRTAVPAEGWDRRLRRPIR